MSDPKNTITMTPMPVQLSTELLPEGIPPQPTSPEMASLAGALHKSFELATEPRERNPFDLTLRTATPAELDEVVRTSAVPGLPPHTYDEQRNAAVLDVPHSIGGRPSWDDYFIGMANLASERATCDRKHVGAVIVRARQILATGYNGSLPGLPHCDDIGHDIVDDHCIRTAHAEANAIAHCARTGTSTRGATLYVNTYPCWQCMKLIVQAGILEIVFEAAYREDARVQNAAHEAGIQLRQYVRNAP